MKTKLFLLLIIVAAIFASTSCNGTEVFVVTFTGDYIEPTYSSVKKDETAVRPSDPEADEFEFLYWADESGEKYDFSSPVTSDITLTAVWQHMPPEKQVNYYTVRFFDPQGKQISEQRVEEGKSAVAPVIVTDDFFTVEWDRSFDSVTANIDVHSSLKYDSASSDLFTYEPVGDSSYVITGIANASELPHMSNGLVKLALPTEYNGLPISGIADGGVFENKNIYSLYIPSCYKRIGANAFKANAELTNVVFNEGLVEIGAAAFMASDVDGHYFYGAYSHAGAPALISGLSKLDFPSTLESIGDYAFYHIGGVNENGYFTELDVKADFTKCRKLSYIGEHAFEGAMLGELTLPSTESPLYIGNYAFAADTYLNWVQTDSFDYPRSRLSELTLPDTISYIGDYAFYGIGNFCTFFNGGLFRNDKAVKFVSDRLNVGYVGVGAFMDAMLTGRLNLSTPFIGDYAFFGQDLSTINLENVQKIGAFAFARTVGTTPLELKLGKELVTLGDGAFYNNTGLSELDLPNTLSHIGENAFAGCVNLKGTLTLPASVKDIGAWAFRLCGFDRVTIEGKGNFGRQCFAQCGSLRRIDGEIAALGDSVFYGCTSLETLALPSDMRSLPFGLFYGCESLETIRLPETLVAIESSAFYGCTSLSSITIPANVETLGSNAFQYCTSLREVIFEGELIKSIDAYTFAYCRSLSGVDLPNSVTTIGNYAFTGSGLVSFKTPAALQSMGYRVFYQYEYASSRSVKLPVLDTITISKETGMIDFDPQGTFDGSSVLGFEVEDGNENYKAEDGILYSSDCKKLIMYIRSDAVTHIKLADGLEAIEDGAFMNSVNLRTVEFPESLLSIGKFAFYNCPQLQSVTFPSGLKTIAEYAFAGTSDSRSQLKSVTFASDSSVVSIGSYAFAYNAALSTIAVPSSLETIGEKAFYSCSALQNIDFDRARSLKTIGQSAFSGDSKYDAPKITTLDFSGCVILSSTGQNAFAECASLDEINFGGLTKVDKGSFADCTGLTDLYIGSNIVDIESNAFSRCTSIANIVVPDNNSLRSIMSYAFAGSIDKKVNYKTLDLTKAKYLDTIGDGAFAYGNVSTVIMPNTPYSLGDEAFARCSDLGSVELGGAATIGENVFRYCTSLKEITIPSTVTTILKDAFRELELVTVNFGTPESGNNITYLGKNAFFDCLKLTTLNIYGSNLPMLSGEEYNLSFHYSDRNGVTRIIDGLRIYVDADMISDYAQNGGWRTYRDIIVARSAGSEGEASSSTSGIMDL